MVELQGLQATLDLGRRIGESARPGDVVLLEGSLGSGKTVLVRGIALGLGSDDEVVSPTFVLVRHYLGRLPLVHADLYRLDDAREVDRLGLLELAEDGVLAVEWPERAPVLEGHASLWLRLSPGANESSRAAAVILAAGHFGDVVGEP